VNGVARTNVLLLPIAGAENGAIIRLRFDLPATPDIIIQVASVNVANVVSTISTGYVLSAYLDYVFYGTAQQWVPLSYIIPATS